MLIEEKARRYDEAFGLIKRFYHNFKGDAKFIIDKAFPQLNENEDERIRKELIEFFTFEHWNGEAPFSAESAKERITWLEKQGEQKPTIYHKFRAGDTIRHIKQGFTCKIDSVDTEYRVSECGEGTHLPFDSEDYYELVEQKPIDKVEPKFKVGDWVVFNNKHQSIYQVEKIEDGYYILRHTYGGTFRVCVLHDESLRLWTIQDAKDGDVLATSAGAFIYNGNNGGGSCPGSYCGIDTLGRFKTGVEHHWTGKVIHPATKEQRDLLFQKMQEYGYKWENNQFKKIDNNGDYVDLGLPSGTLWAKCNLGAEKETDLGLFYQWGNTEGYDNNAEYDLTWTTYKWGTENNLTKYNKNDNKLVLDNEDDPIYISTNGKMKSPTKKQLQELINNTDHKWTEIDGVKGIKFSNKSDYTKYIFIPAVGCYYGSDHNGMNTWGYIWSSSRDSYMPNRAWSMYFASVDVSMSYNHRCVGFNVRGVLNKNKL